jgi:ABC-2 type transport system ATP-binding protein
MTGIRDNGGGAAAVVELEGVTKRFRGHTAVDQFDLRVPAGSIFGFIGPNGSGKTTTLRMILRIIEPDCGAVRVFGRPHQPAANDAIGYLPEERGMYRKLPILRQLVFFGRLKGMSGADARRAALEWLERLDLLAWRNKRIEALSKGMGQKIQLIATILARPRLLILDEPFTGLDPVNQEAIREVLLELRRGGTTLIFSTHDMHTAEQLCDQVCMIYKGRKVLDGSLGQIQSTYGQDTLRLRFADGVHLEEGQLQGVSHIRHLGRFWEMRFHADPHAILRQAAALGQLDHFEITRPSLHDIFVRIAQPARENGGQAEPAGPAQAQEDGHA